VSKHRWITIPPNMPVDVALCLACGHGRESHAQHFVRDFVMPLLDGDNLWGLSAKSGRANAHLAEAFEGKEPGDVVKVRYDDWELLKASANSPRFGDPRNPAGYRPKTLRQLLPWIDLIDNAADKDPGDQQNSTEPAP
jgi:hypothetical protein